MPRKYSFAWVAFANLKWGFILAILLLTGWLFAFIEEPNVILPVIEKINPAGQAVQSRTDYKLYDSQNTATLEAETGFFQRLFLSRPVFNLDFLSCLYILFITFAIYRIVKNIEKDTSFKTKTYKLFYTIGFGTLIYCIIYVVIKELVNDYVVDVTAGKYTLRWGFENFFVVAFISYFFFILGYSFKKGFLLQKEQDLTI